MNFEGNYSLEANILSDMRTSTNHLILYYSDEYIISVTSYALKMLDIYRISSISLFILIHFSYSKYDLAYTPKIPFVLFSRVLPLYTSNTGCTYLPYQWLILHEYIGWKHKCCWSLYRHISKRMPLFPWSFYVWSNIKRCN